VTVSLPSKVFLPTRNRVNSGVGRPKGEQDEEMESTFDSFGVVWNSSRSSCFISPTINYSSKLKPFLRASWGGHDWHRAIQSAIESLGGLA
jgi:hypothetical protein